MVSVSASKQFRSNRGLTHVRYALLVWAAEHARQRRVLLDSAKGSMVEGARKIRSVLMSAHTETQKSIRSCCAMITENCFYMGWLIQIWRRGVYSLLSLDIAKISKCRLFGNVCGMLFVCFLSWEAAECE